MSGTAGIPAPSGRGGRQSTEYDVERYFRDAPLMIVGEGTNEIQRNVIAAQLIARGGLDR
jgi:alkylation response protein AidB-like acyl-CoA dehydrogenase